MPVGYSAGSNKRETRMLNVVLRLPGDEALGLRAAADQMGMAPDEWLRCLLRAHLTRGPQWSSEDLEGMTDAANAIRQIANLASGEGGVRHAGDALASQVMEAFLSRVSQEADRRRAYWLCS